METHDIFLTKDEVAKRLRCTRRTVDNLISQRRIPFTKVGRLVRFDWPRVQRALERFTVKAVGE